MESEDASEVPPSLQGSRSRETSAARSGNPTKPTRRLEGHSQHSRGAYPPLQFDEAQRLRRKRDEDGSHCKHPRGRGKYLNYLLTGLITCGDCGHKYQGWIHKIRPSKKNPNPERPLFYLCGGYITKGRAVCKHTTAALEDYILSRLQARLMVFLNDGGDQILRQYIREELTHGSTNPKAQLNCVESELAALKMDVDRLLNNLTQGSRDFVDEKLKEIRSRKRELEAKRENLQDMVVDVPDVEALTACAGPRYARCWSKEPSSRKRNSCAAWWRGSRFS